MKSYEIDDRRNIELGFAIRDVQNRVCKSNDYLKYLLHLYNEEPQTLTPAECLWIEKYLQGFGDYCIVNIDGREQVMLCSEALEKGYSNYIEKYNPSNKYFFKPVCPRKSLESFLKKTLLPNGFEVIYVDEQQLIAFNKEKFITFYVDDINAYNAKYYYFQKPVMVSSNKIEMTRYNNLYDCDTSFCEFPIFKVTNYLDLYSINDEGDSFKVSMKKISQIPCLMETIGKDNQEIVRNTIYSSENKVKLKK